MYIIITGINSVSKRLVKDLMKNDDVVVVEEDDSKAERIYSDLGVEVVKGAPTNISVLEDAGISKADVLVTTLEDDNRNMVISMLGQKYGVPDVVTRVENSEYRDIYNMLEVNTIEYNDIVFSEFLSVIKHPAIRKIANIGKDKEILQITVTENSEFNDLRIDEIKSIDDFPDQKVGFSGILREGEIFQANDTVRLETDDSLVLIAEQDAKEDVNKVLD
ncbi:MAG: NAD-binding protein [Candidatus Nanohaloarchaeota archaeon QJJ-9]|nr:NAD-binding protein [Candidatus Nanohaloarchaeota archaeon QJJ-9]